MRYLRACQEWVAVPGSEGCVEALRRVAVFLRGPASARVVFRRPRPNSCLLRISLETAACCQTPQARSCHWARRGSSQRKVARRSPTHRSTRGSNQHSSKHHCRSGRPLPDFLPAPCLHACSGSRLLSATRITSRSLRKDKKDKKTPHLVINIINQRLTSLSPTFIS